MIMKFLFLFLIFVSTAEAFTLNNNFAASFKKNRVKVYVAGDSTCANINVTAADLQSYVKPAVDKFWNEVPTSRLRLENIAYVERHPEHKNMLRFKCLVYIGFEPALIDENLLNSEEKEQLEAYEAVCLKRGTSLRALK
jgi:gamma-glutamylcysteine synthetase